MRGESGFLDAPLSGVGWKQRYMMTNRSERSNHELRTPGRGSTRAVSKVRSGSLCSMSTASLAIARRKRKLQPLLSPEQKSELSLTLCAPILMEHVPKKLHGTL